MNRRSKKKMLVTIICICFIVISFLTTTFIVTHAEHDCTGNDCHTCAQIHIAENLLKQLGMLVAVFAFILAGSFADINIIQMTSSHIYHTTPITLKVRMNN